MRHFLAILLVATVGASAHAQNKDAHEKCLKAADYKGCMEVQNGSGNPAVSATDKLVETMKILPSRLANSSRVQLYANIQPFSDALSLANASSPGTDYEREILTGANRVRRLIDIMAETWSDQINLRIKYKYYTKPACDNAQGHISSFNYAAGKQLVSYYEYKERVLWQTTTHCNNPTSSMLSAITSEINTLAEDPKAKKARLLQQKKERELAEMEPWVRHLEQNPDLKKWAEANPAAAEKAKTKFLENLGKERDQTNSK